MKRKNIFMKAMAFMLAAAMITATVACGTDDEKEATKKVSEKSTTSSRKDSGNKESSSQKEDTSEDETKPTDEETTGDETSGSDQVTEENTGDGSEGSGGNTNNNENTGNDNNAGGNENTNNSGNAGGNGNTNNGSNANNSGNANNNGNAGNSGSTNNNGGTNNGSSATTPVNTGTAIKNRVSVHDPSIVVGTDKAGKKCYYIFGSHMAWAKSYDLQNWEHFTNNINRSYNTLFAKEFDWARNGDPAYDSSKNIWAPDVIWNPNMNKWCMYMSINGWSWNSSIVLLTADSLEGDWTYVGPVIYSGFTSGGTYSYTKTDYGDVTNDRNFEKGGRFYGNPFQFTDNDKGSKCEATTWNCVLGAHAIDPCVIFDKNGDLYMSYGSWSGGIWMIKLDKTTGLRDNTHKYGESNLTNAVEDPYMGKKISGATGATGEASYIVYDSATDYYYLYVTYGGLVADGGYHIRLFRSKTIDGTYVDYDGTRANKRGGNRDGIGIKLFGNYNFKSLSTSNANAQKGYKSGGHNSAFIDDDGSHYLIYHTRFNLGNEWHQVRVHQQFLNEDGWLVTAVYEYLGNKISTTGYSMDDMAGTYEMVNMGTSSATSNVGMLSNGSLTLNTNGTLSGAYTGTWSHNNQYVTLNINGTAYKGVFFKQYDESSSHKEVMTFTVIGADTSIWGTK